ncbi:MAG: 4Fe-4S dicluster domain-containing protein [Planctomycetes bacterium]|nr:4Fe-4S dicluster domain-containing protein [Planctomycetota bacterium]
MASILSVESNTCTRCGSCAAACPMAFIRIGAKGPRTVPAAQEACMLCGHCVAACPAGALSHSRLAEHFAPLDEAWRGDVHGVEQMIKGRRSIRKYQQRQVDRSVLTAVLEAARYAPTAMNTQPVKWLVVYEAAEVRKLAAATIDWMRAVVAEGKLVAGKYDPSPLVMAWDGGVDLILRACPHVIIAYGRQDNPMAAGACIAALTTAELAAIPHGLGTCWAGFLHMAAMLHPPAREAIGLDDGCVMHGALMIGYPAEQYRRVPPRSPLSLTWR